MPYIKDFERRKRIVLGEDTPKDSGELNFTLTEILNNYIHDKGLCYKTINDIVGALECAKLEFYRRIPAPYEDKKIIENGDAYSEEFIK